MACLSDLDAYCIKSNRTKSLSECQSQIDTVLKEMAFRRLMSDLPKLSICMTVLTHLRYRVIQITNDVSANATKFSSDYQLIYSNYLSPESQASSSKKRRVSIDTSHSCSSTFRTSIVTSSCNSSLPEYTETTNMCVANDSHYEQFVDPVVDKNEDFNFNEDLSINTEHTMSIENASIPCTSEHYTERTISIENVSAPYYASEHCTVRTTSIENDSTHCISDDLIIDQNDVTLFRHFPDYSDYFQQCPCISLNIPSMFHCDCVDLSTLLEPFEPSYIRNEYGDKIEIHDPQKLIGSKRSRDQLSLDEIYSIGSTRIPAESSNSTMNLVDWRELLSWASSGGRFSRLPDDD